MGTGYDAIVIGGGTNGLVASLVLARRGRRVLLVEQATETGGDARPTEFAPGFLAAPTALDQGWVPRAVLAATGVGAPALRRSEMTVAVGQGDGRFLTLSADPARAADQLRPLSVRDADRWAPFTVRLRKLAGFLEALYQQPAPDIEASSLGELIPLAGLGARFRALGREDMIELLRALPMSVQELLDDIFETEVLKAGLAAAALRDIQQGPRSGGTGFLLLHHLVGSPAGAVQRAAWWEAGPDALVRRLDAAARQAGVTIRTGTAVARIEVRHDAVAGVVLASGEEIAAGAILSTLDPARTLLGLVDPAWLDPELLHAVGKIKFRGARATVLFGVEGEPGLPGDGVVSLTPTTVAMERACDAAKYGSVSPVPHVTVAVPSRRWPGHAPAGHHVVVAHVQWAPFRLRDAAGWSPARREALADATSRAIDQAAPGFAGRVRHRQVLSPVDLAERYGLTEGAVSHGELTLDQVLFMRPLPGLGRYRMPVAGLYLGGAGAHPGPGILGGPAWLAARTLLADRRP